MKRLYWVNSLFILLLLICAACVSCSTISESDRNEIVANAIKLADRYCTLGETEKAIEVYDRVIETCPDWRLFYNKAVLFNSLQKPMKAMSVCLEAYRETGKKELLEYRLKLAKENNSYQIEEETSSLLYELDTSNPTYFYEKVSALSKLNESKAYSLILEFWNAGNHTKEAAQLLYDMNPEEWKNVCKALGGVVEVQ